MGGMDQNACPKYEKSFPLNSSNKHICINIHSCNKSDNSNSNNTLFLISLQASCFLGETTFQTFDAAMLTHHCMGPSFADAIEPNNEESNGR